MLEAWLLSWIPFILESEAHQYLSDVIGMRLFFGIKVIILQILFVVSFMGSIYLFINWLERRG